MRKPLDLTVPVLVDVLTAELKATCEIVKEQAGVDEYICEIALERLLSEYRENRIIATSNTLFHRGRSESDLSKEGESENV